ncbi:hypothetical protein AB0H67_28775 [Streptomyces phaeochromogenes]
MPDDPDRIMTEKRPCPTVRDGQEIIDTGLDKLDKGRVTVRRRLTK